MTTKYHGYQESVPDSVQNQNMELAIKMMAAAHWAAQKVSSVEDADEGEETVPEREQVDELPVLPTDPHLIISQLPADSLLDKNKGHVAHRHPPAIPELEQMETRHLDRKA